MNETPAMKKYTRKRKRRRSQSKLLQLFLFLIYACLYTLPKQLLAAAVDVICSCRYGFASFFSLAVNYLYVAVVAIRGCRAALCTSFGVFISIR